MAVKKKSTAKKPVKKAAVKKTAKKTTAKRVVKKAAAKKTAKKSTAKKTTAKRVVKKAAVKKPVKKAAVKKTSKKTTAKRVVKKAAKKATAASKIVVPPVPLTGVTRTDRVNVSTTPVTAVTPTPVAPKPSSSPKQGTSNRVLLAAVVGIVILALIVIAKPGKDKDDNAAPQIPAASQSPEPTAEATMEATPEASTEAVVTVEAPSRFIGNWKDSARTIMSLTWRAPVATDGLTGYKVEVRSNMGEWKVISELPATTLEFEMKKISTDGSTSFRVSSVYSDGQMAEAKAFGFAGQFE